MHRAALYSKGNSHSLTSSLDNDPLMERIKVGSLCLAAVLHSLLLKTGFAGAGLPRGCAPSPRLSLLLASRCPNPMAVCMAEAPKWLHVSILVLSEVRKAYFGA